MIEKNFNMETLNVSENVLSLKQDPETQKFINYCTAMQPFQSIDLFKKFGVCPKGSAPFCLWQKGSFAGVR